MTHGFSLGNIIGSKCSKAQEPQYLCLMVLQSDLPTVSQMFLTKVACSTGYCWKPYCHLGRKVTPRTKLMYVGRKKLWEIQRNMASTLTDFHLNPTLSHVFYFCCLKRILFNTSTSLDGNFYLQINMLIHQTDLTMCVRRGHLKAMSWLPYVSI